MDPFPDLIFFSPFDHRTYFTFELGQKGIVLN